MRFVPRTLRRLLRACRGGVTALATTGILMVLMIGGVAVDVGYAFLERGRMQGAVDAAALGAALRLETPDEVETTARDLVARNLPERPTVVVERGRMEKGVFTPDPATPEPDAVRVVARRAPESGDALPTFLLRLMGHVGWSIAVSATAEAVLGPPDRGPCGALAFSEQVVDVRGGASFGRFVCLHGQGGVDVKGGATLNPDMRISAPSLGLISVGSGHRGADPAAISVADEQAATVLPHLSDRFDSLWSALAARSEAGADLLPAFMLAPDGFAEVVEIADDPWRPRRADLSPNTVYLAPGDVQTQGGSNYDRVGILARGEIHLGGGGGGPRRVMFFARAGLHLTGSNDFGAPGDPCLDGTFSAYLLGIGGVDVAGGTWLNGALVAGPEVNIRGGAELAGPFLIESAEDLDIAGGSTSHTCDRGLAEELDLQEERIRSARLRG